MPASLAFRGWWRYRVRSGASVEIRMTSQFSVGLRST
jgi:hypothetical protein